MTPRLVLLALLLPLALACGGERKTVPAPTEEQVRTRQEALKNLQNQAQEISQSAQELQTYAAKIAYLEDQVEELKTKLAFYVDRYGGPTTPLEAQRLGALTKIWFVLLGVVLTFIFYFGFRLVRGYDEGELPPEVYTPGMKTTAPPTDEESPRP